MFAAPSPAHGGRLKLLLGAAPADIERLPVLKLTPRQQCDVEMLLCGAYSPLDGFQGRDDYLAVLQTGRLADGTLWPLPVVLDVDRATVGAIGRLEKILLVDAELHPVALFRPGEYWQPDRAGEAKALFGTDDVRHAGARALLHETAPYYVSGRLDGLRLPVTRSFAEYRSTPEEQRRRLGEAHAAACLAAVPRGPLYRSGFVVIERALASCGADHLLLLHNPDFSAPGAPPGRVTARCLTAVLPRLGRLTRPAYCRYGRRPRYAGARDIIENAIVAQNFGATHLLIDCIPDMDDMAPPSRARHARDLLEAAGRDLAIRLVDVTADAPGDGGRALAALSEDDLRAAAQSCFEEEIDVLRRHYRRGATRGFALFLTGLSGSGKSSLAHALAEHIENRFGRTVTVLDGDYSRYLLTSDLSATLDDQRRNVLRHAVVAGEIVRHGGVAICALVAPEAAARYIARDFIEAHGRFVEIYLSAPATVCEARDEKRIYARGRAGLLGLTPATPGAGYEPPSNAELTLDSGRESVANLAAPVLDYLVAQNLLALSER